MGILSIFLKVETWLQFVNLGRAPLKSLPLCRAPILPRRGKLWVESVSGTSRDWKCLQRCYFQQTCSSQVRRSPCPPLPMNMERYSLAPSLAWGLQSHTSSSSLSVDEDVHFPEASSFHQWWILEQYFTFHSYCHLFFIWVGYGLFRSYLHAPAQLQRSLQFRMRNLCVACIYL